MTIFSMKGDKKMDSFKIIIYNDEFMEYFIGDVCDIPLMKAPQEVEITSLLDNNRRFIPGPTKSIEIITVNSECMENIKLDETLMKRIARYNKEKEIERLDEEIKEKQEKIKELDDVLKDREKRVQKLKKFVAEIYDIDVNDEDDDYDYEDDNW